MYGSEGVKPRLYCLTVNWEILVYLILTVLKTSMFLFAKKSVPIDA